MASSCDSVTHISVSNNPVLLNGTITRLEPLIIRACCISWTQADASTSILCLASCSRHDTGTIKQHDASGHSQRSPADLKDLDYNMKFHAWWICTPLVGCLPSIQGNRGSVGPLVVARTLWAQANAGTNDKEGLIRISPTSITMPSNNDVAEASSKLTCEEMKDNKLLSQLIYSTEDIAVLSTSQLEDHCDVLAQPMIGLH